jgi:hypothetical protein
VVHDAVVLRVHAEARSLRQIAGDVRPARGRIGIEDRRGIALEERPDELVHLLVGVREAEVEVEVVVTARDPREAPAHPLLVGEEPLDRRS